MNGLLWSFLFLLSLGATIAFFGISGDMAKREGGHDALYVTLFALGVVSGGVMLISFFGILGRIRDG